MSALPKRYFTPEEYLTLEVRADYKSQYVAGEIYAMSGAQPAHVALEINLIRELGNRLLEKGCHLYSSNMRVQSDRADLWTYPDVSALCGTPRFNRSHNPPSLLNPQAIFEVLSSSTEAFDRGDKFARYQSIPELADYVLISADRVRIDHFTRQPDNRWLLSVHDQPEQILVLSSLGCELPLAQIYRRIVFPADEREGA